MVSHKIYAYTSNASGLPSLARIRLVGIFSTSEPGVVCFVIHYSIGSLPGTAGCGLVRVRKARKTKERITLNQLNVYFESGLYIK